MQKISKNDMGLRLTQIQKLIDEAINTKDRISLVDLLGLVENKISHYTGVLNNLETQQSDIKSHPEKYTDDINKISNEISIKCKETESKLQSYSDLRKIIIDEYKTYKNYDKTITIKNIRYLLKENPNIKIGRIEREANVGIGYLSRISKYENISDPSIEFIVTAAKLLNVNVHQLINYDLCNGLTPNEESIRKFIDSIYEDTTEGIIQWSPCNIDELDKTSEATKSPNSQAPTPEELSSDHRPNKPIWGEDYTDILQNDAFKAQLSKTNAQIIILRIKYHHLTKNITKFEYEIYSRKEGHLIHICNTYKQNIMIKDKILNLFNTISTYCSDFPLSSEAKNFINEYLNNYNGG